MRKLFLTSIQLFIGLLSFCQQFAVSYSKNVYDKPFSGKVFLYLSKDRPEPRDGFVGLESFPCFAIGVTNVKPGDEVFFDDKAISSPAVLSDLERNDYYVQAVWDRNLGGRAISQSAGNMYSIPVKIKLTKNFQETFSIQCDQVVAEQTFKDTKFVKELKVPSPLLSAFHHRPYALAGAISLPKSYYDQPQKKYPLVITVFGYGGDYHGLSGDTASRSTLDSVETITLYLDGNCPLGHSVYANSDNNGPWGDALVKEFIPQLEKQYRCDGARLLRGHSSGGWTVLWLQTHYPSFFTGCWSSSPDPVDFRDFQKLNLYEGVNMFYAKDSSLVPGATVAARFTWASMKMAYQAEKVISRGEQMRSFDAVFSGKGSDGEPEWICNTATGDVDQKVLEHWKKYDISLYLRTNWDKLQKDLYGKIRVSAGEQDNFFLNSAVHLLDSEMKKFNTGFVFAYYPGDHFTVFTPEYRSAASHFLLERYFQWRKQVKKAF